MSKPAYVSKQEWLSQCVSSRFASPKQELAIQTTAGILREAAAEKGGHNSKRLPYEKNDDMRDKKVPYGKARWGTLVRPGWKYPEERYEQKPEVVKIMQRTIAYKAKLNSKAWKRGRAQ